MSALQIPLVECPIWVATQPVDNNMLKYLHDSHPNLIYQKDQ